MESEDTEHAGNFLGVTPPISLAEPFDIEKEMTELLEDHMYSLGIYEDLGSIKHRDELLPELQQIVRTWAVEIISQKDASKGQTEDLGTYLMAYGGYTLGLITKDSDLDIVCIAPECLTMEEFFSSLPDKLRSLDQVTSLRAVRAARVPVIKMVFRGVKVDMCLATLPLESVPADFDIEDMTVIAEMDYPSILSINGYRNTETILSLVPDIEIFKRSLKVIKHWAKCQLLHSSVMGFLGGIAWTVMVARICQLYPYTTAATIVNKFFKIYANWEWPQPVILKELEDDKYDLQPWNPKIIAADRHHLMPVITPSCPEVNCAFNVTESTKAILQEAFQHAGELTDKIIEKKAEWSQIFEQPSFFRKYKHFLMIIAKAATHEDLLEWTGLVESKLRILVQNVERQSSVTLAHPHPHSFPASGASNEPILHWLVGLEFEKSDGIQLDLGPDIKSFRTSLKEQATSRNIFQKGMQIEITHVRRKLLNKHLPPEVLLH